MRLADRLHLVGGPNGIFRSDLDGYPRENFAVCLELK
jgi:hypothetical protein